MSLRDPSYQSDIELGLADTEYVAVLKFERERLYKELYKLPPCNCTATEAMRRAGINQQLVRIEELLAK